MRNKIEYIVGKWWFYVILAIALFLPSYSTIKYASTDTTKVIEEVLRNPLIYTYPALFTLSKLLMIEMVAGVIVFSYMYRKIFAYYIFALLMVVAIFQNSANTADYGFVFLVGNAIVTVLVALAWLREAIKPENEYTKPKDWGWKWMLVPLVLLAFWFPANSLAQPDWSFAELFSNGAMLTYCMVTPILLFLLITAYPRVNIVTFKLTRFVALMFAIMNMITWFVLNNDYWYMGIMHLPLLILSVIAMCMNAKNIKVSI